MHLPQASPLLPLFALLLSTTTTALPSYSLNPRSSTSPLNSTTTTTALTPSSPPSSSPSSPSSSSPSTSSDSSLSSDSDSDPDSDESTLCLNQNNAAACQYLDWSPKLADFLRKSTAPGVVGSIIKPSNETAPPSEMTGADTAVAADQDKKKKRMMRVKRDDAGNVTTTATTTTDSGKDGSAGGEASKNPSISLDGNHMAYLAKIGMATGGGENDYDGDDDDQGGNDDDDDDDDDEKEGLGMQGQGGRGGGRGGRVGSSIDGPWNEGQREEAS